MNKTLRAGLVAAVACITILVSAPAAVALSTDPGPGDGGGGGGGGTVGGGGTGGGTTSSVALPHSLIRSMIPGKCMTVDDGNPVAATAVVLRECSNLSDQKWTESGGSLVADDGLCLTGDTYATPLFVAACTGATNQQFHYTGLAIDSYSGWCVDDPSASQNQGVQLQLWSCNGTNAQQYSEPGGPLQSTSFAFGSYIQAENYNAQYGTGIRTDPGGTTYVGYISNGDWTQYNNVNFSSGPSTADLSLNIAVTLPGQIEVHLDSLNNTPVATLVPNVYPGWYNFIDYTFPLTGITGYHTVILRYVTSGGDFMNIDWLMAHY